MYVDYVITNEYYIPGYQSQLFNILDFVYNIVVYNKLGKSVNYCKGTGYCQV